ncbi:hypothetical protein TSUD_179620 [Trifolium subterraneum]|uniref:Uncharacterized protein n=1 Tax=Trifolium subterraneum TaxID=3900 RepID=A0A2Z6PHC0_TRISU|nr:hypothetical protein TSUD_179620 [Trifolium subterraneum]
MEQGDERMARTSDVHGVVEQQHLMQQPNSNGCHNIFYSILLTSFRGWGYMCTRDNVLNTIDNKTL